MLRLGFGEVSGDPDVARGLTRPAGLSAECVQTVKNAPQRWVRTRRKQAPVAEPTVRRSDWVGYYEIYVEKLTVKRFVTR